MVSVLFVSACTNSNENDTDQGPALFPQPKTFPVNTDDGYITNTLTGDTIQPIINSFGDTVITGKPIPAIGKYIHPDSVLKPKSFPAGQGKVVPAHPNVHLIPENLTTIPVDESKLKKIAVTEGENHFILNSIGDTVKTGVPIPTTGKQVPCIFPKSTPALPLRMKDDAICDIRYLDVDQGMLSSYVHCMLEDKCGNIWFCSLIGVTKYNGKSFVHFTKNEGLSGNAVLSILEDKTGNIWFGTWGGGVSKYDGKSFVHFGENEGLSSNIVWSMLEDKSGNLWFGTLGAGASKYDGKSFVHFTENEGLSNNDVKSIFEDKSGNLWFGTDGGGVSKYDGKSFVHFTENEGLSNNVVRSILEDKSGNLWFGTDGGGLSMYNGNCLDDIMNGTNLYQHNQQDHTKENGNLVKSFVHFTENEGLSNNVVWSIFEDESGNLWFGTGGGGVSKLVMSDGKGYEDKSFVHFTDEEGLSDNGVVSILQDESGNLWFGTDGGGVSMYDEKSFVHFTENEEFVGSVVWSILEDKSGNIWFGTDRGDVSMYDGKSLVHFTEIDGLLNNPVMSIIEDKSGNLWFSSYGGGVLKYDGKSFVHFTENEGLSSNIVRAILEDQSGNLWFGTEGGGVSRYDGKSFVHFTESKGLSNNIVTSILEDKSGNLWFGTFGGGVTRYDGKSFVYFTENEGLSDNIVFSTLADKSGNLWFASYNGVTKFDGKNFVHFTENEGLSYNFVLSILDGRLDSNQEGTTGNIWLGTEKGLSLIRLESADLTDNTASEDLGNNFEKNKSGTPGYRIFTLQKEDGLKGLDFYNNSVLLDSKNRMWWGASKCVEMLDLNKFKLSEKIPVATLKSLDINETTFDYWNLEDSLKQIIQYDSVAAFENYPLNLVLPYDQNHLTFHFSAIDWAAPHKLKYQYKLDGLDEIWSPVSDKTFADYRNIPYGTFTFKVRVIGESQIWGEPFEYTFTILPPWWHTWWARTIYLLLALTLILTLIRWRTAALRARQKQLERDIEKATFEIVQQKIQVEEAHKEITDSINYAERIQRSLMASKKLLDENLSDYFIYFNPKEKVSGDFYWATKLVNDRFCLVAADSTGHGVPGAIMSMLNISSLEKAVAEKISDSSELLNFTRKKIIQTLSNDGSAEGGKDGMDAALLIFNHENNKLEFTLANNPLWLIRKGELIEFKADKMPVGKHDRQDIPFSKNEIDLQKGDVIYIFTDGYADQFGGEKGKKFKYASLKELLISNHHKSLEEQNMILKMTFENWRGSLEQVDDVCVIGVRV